MCKPAESWPEIMGIKSKRFYLINIQAGGGCFRSGELFDIAVFDFLSKVGLRNVFEPAMAVIIAE